AAQAQRELPGASRAVASTRSPIASTSRSASRPSGRRSNERTASRTSSWVAAVLRGVDLRLPSLSLNLPIGCLRLESEISLLAQPLDPGADPREVCVEADGLVMLRELPVALQRVDVDQPKQLAQADRAQPQRRGVELGEVGDAVHHAGVGVAVAEPERVADLVGDQLVAALA